MRRADKEITEVCELQAILDKCQVCRVAMNDGDDGIYVLPVNFGYSYRQGTLEIYFHGALKGKKVDILSKGDVPVGFEMDCDNDLKVGDTACSYSYRYASIIGKGKASIVAAYAEKVGALDYLMLHTAGKSFEFNEERVNGVAVFKIVVDTYSGKRNY